MAANGGPTATRSFTARGIVGQGIFIDTRWRLVIASNANGVGGALPTPAVQEAREASYCAVPQAIDNKAAPTPVENWVRAKRLGRNRRSDGNSAFAGLTGGIRKLRWRRARHSRRA